MAKGSSIWTDQLVSLLGLDNETVRTQILPFLDSFDAEPALRSHLQGLVGDDSPLARSFVRDFARSRFPQQASSGSSTPTLPAPSSSASSGAPRKRGKKTLAERAGLGQTLEPRKVQDVGLNEEEQMAKLAEAFGGMGTVYRKKNDDEDFFAGTGKGKKRGQPASKADSAHEPGPATRPDTSASAVIDATPPNEAMHTATAVDEETSAAVHRSQPAPPPTAAMAAIDAVVEELTLSPPSLPGAGSDEVVRKMCFCQGRKHAPAPHAPLCYACGLVLCSAILPSPLSPASRCPSCAASPLLSEVARSDLVAKLTAEREVLFEQQQLQIALQREQKKLNKTAARSAREQEAALFPKLGDQPVAAASASSAAPVIGKHGSLQKARAIAGEAERTAKVLSLDMKTHKLKTHTKLAKPKAAAAAETKVVETKVEEEQDPFVGMDGAPLVRNEKDDGMHAPPRRRRVSSNGVGRRIPPRAWVLAGESVRLRPTPSVK
ncbi:hypothetical protein L1887_58594 [Cichorium endivia]|nr:hypothetical protein L1887_58594 [Cichorium endivia]